MACAALSVGPVVVSVEALSELALLVNATRSAHDRVIDLPQEEHDATSTAETTPMPFEREVSTVVLPAQIAQELVRTLADLLLASAVAADHDEERDDAREDHR